MKKLILILICLVLAGAPALAQESAVRVEVAMDQEQFLLGEDLPVRVRITNLSGQTLKLGSEDDWITFVVESKEGQVVARTGAGGPPIAGEFELESGLVGTKRANLTPYFGITQPGRYQISASVKIPQWAKQLNSPPKRIEIMAGSKLRELEFGVPPKQNSATTVPEIRKYQLTQASYFKQTRLFVRITDASGLNTVKLVPLGPLINFTQPEVQIDSESNLHVLNQTGARAFSYSVVSPEGDILVRQTHDISNKRPSLRPNQEGKFGVVGGTRRPASTDLPATPIPSANEGESKKTNVPDDKVEKP